MIGIARWVAVGLCASLGSPAQAQPAPEAYTLEAVGAYYGRELRVVIVRDGARERIETTLGKGAMTSLYDFAAQRVYWIGWSGEGSCSSGAYLSRRAPVDQDPVTGTADHLKKLTAGRTRRAAGSGAVAGRAARIEELIGGRRPTGKNAEPWPTRVWLAEDGGTLLKLEGEDPAGKPLTLLEITRLVVGKPPGADLEPPPGCVETDSEMDESGLMRARGKASLTAEVRGSAELGASRSPAAAPRAGPLAKIDALTLGVVEQPDDGKCGRKLRVTGSITVDGPATIDYAVEPSVGGLHFAQGVADTLTVEGPGTVTFAREGVPTRPLKGTLRFRAIVKGTNGHNGPLKRSESLPFDLGCGGG